MSIEDVVQSLKKMGLTEYEAKIYATLCMLGQGAVSEISKTSGVPRTSVYDVLNGLKKLGLIEEQYGKPMLYKSIPPEKAVERLRKEIDAAEDQALKSLKKLGKFTAEGGGEAVWVITGKENVKERIIDMLTRASKKAVIMLPPEDLREFTPTLRNLRDRGVEATLMFQLLSIERTTLDALQKITHSAREFTASEVNEAISEAKKALPINGLTILLVDNNEILLGLRKKGKIPGLEEDVALWSNSEGFATVFTWIIERLMGIGEQVKIVEREEEKRE